MVKYYFSKKDSIFYINYYNTITLEDVFTAIDAFGNDNSLPKDLKIFEDVSNSTTEFTIDELELIGRKIQTYLHNFNTIHHAVYNANPRITVLTTLINEYIDVHKLFIKQFATKTAALQWLSPNQIINQ
jgi:hypothetical protein